MASNNSSATGVVYLDTTSAQNSLNKLNETIARYDKLLNDSAISANRRFQVEKDRIEATEKAAKINEQLEKGLGATYKQQTKYVSELAAQLKNLPIGTQEFINKLKELNSAKAVLSEMNKQINNVDEAQKKLVSGDGFFSKTFFANLLANGLTKVISSLKGVAQQAIESSIQAEGVKRAFERLNDPALLAQLRTATRGTVSDLELMKKAVQANNFQLPLESLSSLLQFASQRARDTGENVDYLVESIVTGIARKSPLILDNLGINIQRIQDEFKKTGDFAKAAMNVVNEELIKAGPQLDTVADKVDRFKAGYSNFLTSVGDGLISIAISATEAIQFKHGDAVSLAIEKGQQKQAQDNERFRQQELSAINFYREEYAKADKAGRDKIIANVKAEIEYTKLAEASAILNGEQSLEKNLAKKLDLWQNYLNNIKSDTTKGNTIAGIESEISVLQGSLKNLEIGSKKFIETQNQLKKLQTDLDNANGKRQQPQVNNELKRAEERLKDLIAEYNRLTKSSYANEFAKIFEDKANDEKNFKSLYSGKNLQDRLDQLQKTTEQRVIDLNKRLGANVKEKPIVLDVIPEIKDEDITAVKNAANKLLKQLGEDERNAAAQRSLTLLTGTNRQKLDATIGNLNAAEEKELSNTELLESEKEVIRERYRQQRGQAELDFTNKELENINEVLNFASQAIDIIGKFNDAQNNRENRLLTKELKDNDVKKAAYKKQLDSKLITQQQYNQFSDQLDKEADKKKEDLARKQFERNKRQQIAAALVNGALGVTSVLAAKPGVTDILTLSLFRTIMIGLTVATTAAQIAQIASSKYALGGKLHGPSHSAGGIKRIVNGHRVEFEGDEGVIKKSAMRSNRRYTVTGTPSQITSSLNGIYGGVTWDTSAILTPIYKRRSYQAVDYNRINRSYSNLKFAEGGIVPGGIVPGGNNSSSFDNPLIGTLQLIHDTIGNLQNTLSSGIETKFYLTKLENAQNQKQRIEYNAGFK